MADYIQKQEFDASSVDHAHDNAIYNEEQEFGAVKRDLKSRHLQMIAIGGTIGTGIFLSSGGSVAAAGPLGALISYTIVGECSQLSKQPQVDGIQPCFVCSRSP
ncbi:hypothetical protein BGZ68_006179 [Mortierella alpina]|nr:hypothetical protein BGZ68_006179 [Mortierella alpina]